MPVLRAVGSPATAETGWHFSARTSPCIDWGSRHRLRKPHVPCRLFLLPLGPRPRDDLGAVARGLAPAPQGNLARTPHGASEARTGGPRPSNLKQTER